MGMGVSKRSEKPALPAEVDSRSEEGVAVWLPDSKGRVMKDFKSVIFVKK